MTPSEFKAWFDGFTEAFTGLPTKAQWARIKDRVGEIDGRPVTERVYVDRWWPTVRPYYGGGPGWTYLGGSSVCQSSGAYHNVVNDSGGSHSNVFNSLSAMNALGRADAASLG